MEQDPDDSEELLRRAAAGAEAALAVIWERHRARLRQMIRLRPDRRLQGRVDSSDVLQDSYLDLAARLPDYARERPMPTYLWLRLVTGNGTEGGLRIGPPRVLAATKGRYSTNYTWDRAGRRVLVDAAARTHAVVLDLASSAEVARPGPHPGLHVAKVPGRECRLWHVGSWHPGPAIQGGSTMAFSRDGRLFAIDDGGRIRTVAPDTGREVATLDPGTGSLTAFFCLAISPDGTQVAGGRDHFIHLWDQRLIRAGLAAIGLDWDRPPYPPASPGARESGPGPIVIDSGL
jgi:hypothetical protein